jgi:hypothetical protein
MGDAATERKSVVRRPCERVSEEEWEVRYDLAAAYEAYGAHKWTDQSTPFGTGARDRIRLINPHGF